MTISTICRTALAAALALSLAACGPSATEEDAAAPSAEVTTAAEPTEEPTPSRTPDPEAPEPAIFADGDNMAHTMCELWTTALEDEGDLRDVADDVTWYASQVDNEFMQSRIAGPWGVDDPGATSVICTWNGYEVQDGSPADLLG
ncbi:hypothetical protein [Brachybacterium tyrofermentans]|uniref:hypothetical protein n=1 Tax=Brachybacterium tyrofermentans TaxID=47848 RepID=UPI003FCF79BD